MEPGTPLRLPADPLKRAQAVAEHYLATAIGMCKEIGKLRKENDALRLDAQDADANARMLRVKLEQVAAELVSTQKKLKGYEGWYSADVDSDRERLLKENSRLRQELALTTQNFAHYRAVIQNPTHDEKRKWLFDTAAVVLNHDKTHGAIGYSSLASAVDNLITEAKVESADLRDQLIEKNEELEDYKQIADANLSVALRLRDAIRAHQAEVDHVLGANSPIIAADKALWRAAE